MARIDGQLSGGNRNTVWAVQIGDQRYVARQSSRPVEALAWEIELLARLRRAGMRVPDILSTRDGRSSVNGIILFGWLDGHAPATAADWRLVYEELTRLHAVTQGWPQRPTFRSSIELLKEDVGGDVRLDLMPADVVLLVRDAWRALEAEPISVVHGDPGVGNILIQDESVGFIDWDEARVDISLLDVAALPLDLGPELGRERLARARRAAMAWEVANGWIPEPRYAQGLLAKLQMQSLRLPLADRCQNHGL